MDQRRHQTGRQAWSTLYCQNYWLGFQKLQESLHKMVPVKGHQVLPKVRSRKEGTETNENRILHSSTNLMKSLNLFVRQKANRDLLSTFFHFELLLLFELTINSEQFCAKTVSLWLFFHQVIAIWVFQNKNRYFEKNTIKNFKVHIHFIFIFKESIILK